MKEENPKIVDFYKERRIQEISQMLRGTPSGKIEIIWKVLTLAQEGKVSQIVDLIQVSLALAQTGKLDRIVEMVQEGKSNAEIFYEIAEKHRDLGQPPDKRS